MSYNLIAYYENGIPYTADGKRILKIIPATISGRDVLNRLKSSFMPSTPNIFPGIGYGSYAKPRETLTDGALYTPGGGISAHDMAKLWQANGKEGICPVCSRKQCPFIEKEINKALGLLDKYRNKPNGETFALMRSDYHFTQPLLNIKNMFNSTAPVVMSHLSMLEGKRFYSTMDNLKGLFEDRYLLDNRIGSFKSLSSNAQTTLQIFAYGNESRKSKYDNFYHHMGSVEGTGRSTQWGKRDFNSAIKELYNNMAPTLKNIFVLDELVKEFDKFGQMSTYVKNIGKLTTDFLKSDFSNSDHKDLVKNQYDFFSGKKTNLQRDIQQYMFAVSNLDKVFNIGGISQGSTNMTTSALRFSTQGSRETNPYGVLQDNDRREGSQVNAFRHTLWQSAITAKYGKEIASRVADAHERYDTLDLSVRHFKTSADADETIDMLNNRTGRQIGMANANTSMKEQAKAILNHFHKEGLYVAKENASGFSVVKEKISDEQFSYMKSQFDRGDNEGFSPEQLAAGKRKEPIVDYQ
ncbi:hypothetical protein AB204_02410 [Xenorhabdus khoisanae]|uniref:DUF6973 domain-containing protein n=1 Tax=Xenorhabdus khoisanae TaxID=880157 RepID=A0A0J5IU42_9GAMM|nr:hypothetical protein [Xenorhabdus khoisanae]KMJ46690.1 hypothetical protein AB204_02410 [Xenorhabdus khoisanae]